MNKTSISVWMNKWLSIVADHAGLISGTFFVAVLLAALCAGLWPFSSPANGAQWDAGANGIRFVRYGTALSRTRLKFPEALTGACTIELLLKPRTPWTRGTPLALYNSASGKSFEVRQAYADLLLVLISGEKSSDWQSRTLQVADVFLKPEFLLTITSDGRLTSVYLNGKLLTVSSSLAFSTTDLAGQVILGNAPVRDHQWTGEIKGLAVYGEQLNPEMILKHAAAWTANGAPDQESPDKPVALYLFREREGTIIHDGGMSGADLDIPHKYVTVDQIRFEKASSEAHDENYRYDAVFNVYGFIPLGFTGALFFGRFLSKARAAAIVVASGFAVSLTIEYFQSFLPTRFSGTTDLFTNTFGTALGFVIGYVALRVITKKWVERMHAQPR